MTAREWLPPRLVDRHTVTTVTVPQAEVLDAICRGHTNAAMARRFGVTPQAIKARVRRLCDAMSARDKSHAVALACSEQVTVIIRGN